MTTQIAVFTGIAQNESGSTHVGDEPVAAHAGLAIMRTLVGQRMAGGIVADIAIAESGAVTIIVDGTSEEALDRFSEEHGFQPTLRIDDEITIKILDNYAMARVNERGATTDHVKFVK